MEIHYCRKSLHKIKLARDNSHFSSNEVSFSLIYNHLLSKIEIVLYESLKICKRHQKGNISFK